MKSKLLRLLSIIAFLVVSEPTMAMTVGGYITMKQRITTLPTAQAKHSRQVLETYLAGIAEGNYAAISFLEYKRKKNSGYQPYTCPPVGLSADYKLAEKMIDTVLIEQPDVDKELNVAVLFVSQMAKTYPCK
ncbi:hypothetical protein [Serratia nevei]|uniref:hypothetical protein n=1 Tax=Serratia nevei TaxID=2703794 RepID=UPI0030172215